MSQTRTDDNFKADILKNETYSKLMFEMMPMGCTIWDEHHNLIDCNQQSVQFLGLSSKQEYIDRFFEFCPKYQTDGRLSLTTIDESLNEAFETGENTFRWLHKSADGELIPVEITMYRASHNGHDIVVSYAKDLRNIYSRMFKLRESYERNLIMLDSTPLCCNFWDENYNNIDCNLAAVKLFGFSSKQEYLDHFNELSPKYQPNGRLSKELVREYLKEAYDKGDKVFEWMHQKPDGEPIPAELILKRVKYGGSFKVISYTRDLRRLKEAEAARDKERLMLEELVETSPVCFAIVVNSIARFVNPFIKDFLGINVGDSVHNYCVNKQDLEDIKASLNDRTGVNWRPIKLKTSDGDIKEMLANIFYTGYFEERGVMVWLIDVTEISRAHKELKRARDAAELSDKAKSEFLANMSHEIRTPMNAIIGMTHLLSRTELTPKQSTYIEKTEQSARVLLRIINDILDFSKIEAGKLEMEKVVFSLKNLVEDVLSLAACVCTDKEVTLNSHIDDKISPALIGDPLRLNQVLLNLINNAVKFTHQGEICVRVGLKQAVNGIETLLFSVKDTGIGMSSEQLKMLFTPFTQVDASTTRRYGGTGLGLAISKNLVAMMNGNIWAESKQGQGSTFYFTAQFNAVEADNDSLAETSKIGNGLETKSEIQYEITDEMKNANVLLAEDNPINEMLTTELLTIEGFNVDVASNGRQAVEMANKKDYDLVLMDIQMPEMDGLQAAKLIRNKDKYKFIPIIAMTANAMIGDKELSLEVGMNDHIAKPIDPALFYSTIAKWLSNRKK